MEENTVKQEENVVEERTFTQAELDAIVSDRLKRERTKYEGFDEFKEKAARLDELEEASKTELQKATERAQALETELAELKRAEEIREVRDKIATETGVPANLLNAETEEACKAQAEAILAFSSKGNNYPSLKDGGEVTNTNKGTTKQQFAKWAADAFG